MDKKKITIVTGTGGILGTGHIQRMLNLAIHLKTKDNFSVSIYLAQNEHPLEKKFNALISASISTDTDLIIKDMRDSTIAEMNAFRRIAPVLTIDDSGAGKDFADFIINLLPVPLDEKSVIKPETSFFLYGHNFAQGISLLENKNPFKKDIDVTVYAGFNPDSGLISSIRESIPHSANSVLMSGGKAVNLSGNVLKTETPYAEIIFRSKIVITHFGLTMFEADVCGCKIAALNPTLYHNKLTEVVMDDLNIIYSCEYNLLSPADLKNKIKTELKKKTQPGITPGEILKKINNGTESLIKYIEKISNNS